MAKIKSERREFLLFIHSFTYSVNKYLSGPTGAQAEIPGRHWERVQLAMTTAGLQELN